MGLSLLGPQPPELATPELIRVMSMLRLETSEDIQFLHETVGKLVDGGCVDFFSRQGGKVVPRILLWNLPPPGCTA